MPTSRTCRISTRLNLLAMSAAVVGCDKFSRVQRTVTLDRLPTTRAVEDALRGTTGVVLVRPHPFDPGLSGRPLAEDLGSDRHQFAYRYESATVGGVVELRQHGDGTNSLSMYNVTFGGRWTQEMVDSCVKLMDQVYDSLRRHAPEVPPATRVKTGLFNAPTPSTL